MSLEIGGARRSKHGYQACFGFSRNRITAEYDQEVGL
jgi:hypothetical protein